MILGPVHAAPAEDDWTVTSSGTSLGAHDGGGGPDRCMKRKRADSGWYVRTNVSRVMEALGTLVNHACRCVHLYGISLGSNTSTDASSHNTNTVARVGSFIGLTSKASEWPRISAENNAARPCGAMLGSVMVPPVALFFVPRFACKMRTSKACCACNST